MQNPPSALAKTLSVFPRLAGSGLALVAAAWLMAPTEEANAFSTIGGSLSAEALRDFRVFNNFSDVTANNNTTPHSAFPGWLGADLALWKGGLEWGSGPHGNGSGDPLHANIGDGGANFDFYWAGNATGVGATNNNIISEIASCSSGVLAFVEIPISDGWRMRFCATAGSWSDGPGSTSTGEGGLDLQGVGTHEFGHALGLGHSNVGTAVMAPTTVNGLSQRNLDPDDIAGVQFIYGLKSGSKPVITSAFVDVGLGTITIEGSNFSSTGNTVRFTNSSATSTGSDPHLEVLSVNSSANGTMIVVSYPAGSGSGDVMVKQAGTGHSTLSNPWPVDLVVGGGSGTDPDATFSATPTSGGSPLTVNFTDESAGAGISSWTWDFGDGTGSTQASPSHTYLAPGSYDVSLAVIGTNGTDTETRPGYINVVAGANCALRLGSGANPNIFSCANDPTIGELWISSVVGGSVGANGLSLMLGFSSPLGAPLPTAFGELLVDPTSSFFLNDTSTVSGGVAAHFITIPSDTSLTGLVVYTQVFLGGVGVLTNGVDVTLGL
ncbi:MAG: PKD repeat protein [Planctomycetota bacterium]|jgi:PKD repeat protein